MPKPWDARQPDRPLRETSLFSLEPVHLNIIRGKMAELGHDVSLRALYRWLDGRKGSTVPKRPVALVLSAVVSGMLNIDQLDVLNALTHKNKEPG